MGGGQWRLRNRIDAAGGVASEQAVHGSYAVWPLYGHRQAQVSMCAVGHFGTHGRRWPRIQHVLCALGRALSHAALSDAACCASVAAA